MLLWMNRRTDLGEPSLLPMDWQTLQQSAVRVRNKTMGSFIAQTRDCSVGQIEGLICSKPFWGKTYQLSWAELVLEGYEFHGLTTRRAT